MNNWFFSEFVGDGSSFSWSIGRHARWMIASLAAGCLLGDPTALCQATPAASLIYTAPGPILGGVAAGPDGVLYFASLSSGSVDSKVTALNPNHTVKWAYDPMVTGTVGDFHPVPSV